jgi:hypothetical protein
MRLKVLKDLNKIKAYQILAKAAKIARSDQNNLNKIKITIPTTNGLFNMEQKLPNGVTVYGTKEIAHKLTLIVDKYPHI